MSAGAGGGCEPLIANSWSSGSTYPSAGRTFMCMVRVSREQHAWMYCTPRQSSITPINFHGTLNKIKFAYQTEGYAEVLILIVKSLLIVKRLFQNNNKNNSATLLLLSNYLEKNTWEIPVMGFPYSSTESLHPGTSFLWSKLFHLINCQKKKKKP